jgi:hypothetical protein
MTRENGSRGVRAQAAGLTQPEQITRPRLKWQCLSENTIS